MQTTTPTPSSADWHYQQGKELLNAGIELANQNQPALDTFKQAAQHFKLAIEKPIDHHTYANTLFGLSAALYHSGEYTEARKHLKTLLQDPSISQESYKKVLKSLEQINQQAPLTAETEGQELPKMSATRHTLFISPPTHGGGSSSAATPVNPENTFCPYSAF
jgi:tetratricopeptide (TPR) repeat protein